MADCSPGKSRTCGERRAVQKQACSERVPVRVMMVLTGFLLAYLAFFLLTCRAKDSGDEWGPQWLS